MTIILIAVLVAISLACDGASRRVARDGAGLKPPEGLKDVPRPPYDSDMEARHV